MGLKDDFVEVFQPVLPEPVDEVCLDQILLDLGSLLPPIPLLQWQITMFDEPLGGAVLNRWPISRVAAPNEILRNRPTPV
jgi:hypothetical protein